MPDEGRKPTCGCREAVGHNSRFCSCGCHAPVGREATFDLCRCGCGCEPDGDWHWSQQPWCRCVASGCTCVTDKTPPARRPS